MTRNRGGEGSLPAVTSEESSLQPKKAIVPLAGGLENPGVRAVISVEIG